SGLMIVTPPSRIAPMPSSGWTGTPSLRTTITSRGAPSARATSAATGTPPRGSASTTTSSPRRCSIRLASRLPASDRSRNGMVIASVLSQSVYPAEGTTEAMVPWWLPLGSGQQGAQERMRAGGVLAASITAGHEVGDAGLGQGADLGADGVLVADDRHVARPGGAFAVEHGPVGRQLPVDREKPGGPLARG